MNDPEVQNKILTLVKDKIKILFSVILSTIIQLFAVPINDNQNFNNQKQLNKHIIVCRLTNHGIRILRIYRESNGVAIMTKGKVYMIFLHDEIILTAHKYWLCSSGLIILSQNLQQNLGLMVSSSIIEIVLVTLFLSFIQRHVA